VTNVVEAASGRSRVVPLERCTIGITDILTLRMRLTIILLGEEVREMNGARQESDGPVVGTTLRSRLATRAKSQRVAAEDCVGCTGCASRAARLLRRLFEIVRSMIAPQLIHFHA
jgi:hypothetical protein